ncbi:MAG: hypothetical protein Q4D39_04060, partial [Coriobacteriaceae bacterium]|nr:hypothetical protein [Coriobacteriaceae bacterium]
MRLDILTDARTAGQIRYRIRCGEDVVGSLAWDGRGSFSIDVFGRSCGLHQPDALERARQLGQGTRMLLATGPF